MTREEFAAMSTMSERREIRRESIHFTRSASAVLKHLQECCDSLLAALPNPIRRAVDLERELKLDKKLAWQVFKIARSSDPLTEGMNVPPRTAVQRLAKAAQRQRVPEGVTERLKGAFDTFESFVDDHAGDRESFNAMVDAVAGDAAGALTEKQRRSMYEANSYLWGIRADATVRCEIFHPNPDVPEKLDSAVVTGAKNLHRLRPDSPISVQVGAYEQDAGINEAGGKPMLLEQFSDTIVGNDWRPAQLGQSELQIAGLGRGTAASFYVLQVHSTGPDEPGLKMNNTVAIGMPLKLLVADMLVPAEWCDPASSKLTIYGSRNRFPFADFTSLDVLPHREHLSTIRDVIPRENVPTLPEFPKYHDVIREVTRQMGWEATQFHMLRCRMAYPLFHTHLRLDVLPALPVR